MVFQMAQTVEKHDKFKISGLYYLIPVVFSKHCAAINVIHIQYKCVVGYYYYSGTSYNILERLSK